MRVAIQRGLLATTILICVVLVPACGDDDDECRVGMTGCVCDVGSSCSVATDQCLAGVCRPSPRDAAMDGATVDAGTDAITPPPDSGCGDTTSNPNHCGACGNVCRFGTCVDSVCQPGLSPVCLVIGPGSPATCDLICGEQGGTCVENGCGEGPSGPFTWAAYGGELSCERMSPNFVRDRPCDIRVNDTTDRTLWIQCCCE